MNDYNPCRCREAEGKKFYSVEVVERVRKYLKLPRPLLMGEGTRKFPSCGCFDSKDDLEFVDEKVLLPNLLEAVDKACRAKK